MPRHRRCDLRQQAEERRPSVRRLHAYAELIEIVALQNDCGETGFVIDRGNEEEKETRQLT
jgi:hypothetical protein